MIHVELLVGAVPTNILGFNLLYGRTWKLPEGSVQSFAGQGDEEIEWFNEDEPNSINLLEISIPLSPSKIINVIRYPLLAAVHLGIDRKKELLLHTFPFQLSCLASGKAEWTVADYD